MPSPARRGEGSSRQSARRSPPPGAPARRAERSAGAMADTRSSEDELIARYFAPIAGEGALGLKDDAAVLRPRPGHDLVVTVDAVVAGVHFFADDPAGSVARKALGVNLSDLAAQGAAPVGFVLTLTLPPDWSEDWLAAFCEGLGAA